MLSFIIVELLSLMVMLFLSSSIRASVNGEAQWSKGVKNAIFYLHEYAHFHREDDYQRYLNSIAIPLGDRLARIELEKPNPNLAIVRAGLLQGRIQSYDIRPLIIQFLYFHKIPFIEEAIQSWAAGDPPLLELQTIGIRIHLKTLAGTLTASDMNQAFSEIKYLNMQMDALADNYSNILGKGSRSLMRRVFVYLLGLALLIGVIEILFILTITKEITKGIFEIIRVSKKIEVADFSERAAVFSNDEIGQLANRFNHMTDKLETSLAKEKQVEEQLRYLAQHDALTGLITRRLLYDRLNQVMAASKRTQQHAAIFYVDIDHFKTINDTLGHEIGDALLKEVAKRLNAGVRASDSVARMGGDEFVLVFPNIIDDQLATAMAQKITTLFNTPILIDSHSIHISVSIGIAIYPEDGENSHTLIKNADKALYRVKEAGRNNYQFYSKT